MGRDTLDGGREVQGMTRRALWFSDHNAQTRSTQSGLTRYRGKETRDRRNEVKSV